MKHLLIILSLLFFPLLSSGQSERPETIIIPVSSLGDVPEVRKQILQNTLTDELKKYFRIVPQEKYEQVLEQVFEELEYEECSEDTCIMRVQEMLQVENVFNLQVLGEDKDTQLNLTWRTLDEKRNETDVCLGCGTFLLNDKVRGLVEKLVGGKRVEPVVEVVKRQKGVLYGRVDSYGKWGWYGYGDEEKDGKYVGEIVNRKPNGQGAYTYSDGDKYVGGWKDGEKQGQGTYTWSVGSKYVGEWKDGKQNGQGMFTWSDFGVKYEGGWKDGEKQGQGTYTYSDGDKYVGEWKDGEKQGQGTYTWSDGKKYVGEYKYGQPNGQGTYTWSVGSKYVGEWKDGKQNGQGTFTWSDFGVKYEGGWKDGKKHGQGTYTYSDGDKYVGEYKYGQPNGQGTETSPDGTKYEGDWKDGKPWTGIFYDKNGNISFKVVNGK